MTFAVELRSVGGKLCTLNAAMALAEGTRLGPYEIVAPLGAGGMGEVYRARDTRLDRTVAVKILPPALAADPPFRERFDREARAISQLTHPHICTLYDVGDHQGTAFLVMELLEGEALSTRLEKGALSIEQALQRAIEIASALDAAHRAGIVHRDLKPANVMLTKVGGAKLLDFGLAKTSGPAIATSGLSMAPTTPPATMTAAGTILGTFQYMAPEQIEGMEADARTDLFAFGCVLYEMLTGTKAFEGKTRASLLGAILKDEPPPVSQQLTLAPSSSKREPDARGSTGSPRVEMLDRIVATCLAKDPDDRWQTARDLMRELKWIAEGGQADSPAPAGAPAPRATRLLVPVAAAAVVAAAAAGIAVWQFMRRMPATRPIVRLHATPPAATPLLIDAIASDLALSPDGRHLAFSAGSGQSQLYVRALDQLEATPIAGVTNLRGPFFSPDGEWIAYFQAADLKKVSVRGGPSVTICRDCSAGNRGGTWGSDDTIVFAPAGGTQGLRRVPAGGGDPVVLTTPDAKQLEGSHMWPEFLPGGQAIVFTIAGGGGAESVRIAARDLKTGVQTTLVRGGGQPHYVTTGHLVYGVAGTLRAVAFDATRLSVMGSPVPVAERVVTKTTGSADFAVSRDGSLAYIAGDALTTGQRLAWIDRHGHEEPIPAPPRAYLYVRLSPDGRRAAVDIRDQQNDVWIWDFSRSVLTRLTTDPALDQSPVWTPDGRRIVFASQRAGPPNLFWQSADGTGAAEPLAPSPRIQIPWSVTPDGRMLVFRDTDSATGSDLSIVSLAGERVVKPLIRTGFAESNAEASPDGRWIAYQSDESGRPEVHVRPFPATDSGHWQISTEGGSRPLWARSGRELFYVDVQGRLVAVPIQPGPNFVAGSASVIEVSALPTAGGLGRQYDISPDGRRFLVVRSGPRAEEKPPPPQLNVILNWQEELKRLVPVKR